MIVIVDYGMGNLRSAQKGFEKAEFDAVISDDPVDIERADAVVLPGVGAFKDCYDGLVQRRMVDPLRAAARSGKPFLGICVGMQLLFEYGEEGAGSPGLGILEGRVVRFPQENMQGLKVPHMGWNQLIQNPARPCPLLDGPKAKPWMYFVHSYFPSPASSDLIWATAVHGVEFPAIVGRENVFGTQFHPEKSQRDGIALLAAFGGFVKGFACTSTS
jgi:glutamine amidotransferase